MRRWSSWGPLARRQGAARRSASSQYLSALLLAGQRAASALEIEVPELTSAPYVGLTLDMIARFGGRVDVAGGNRWIAHPSPLRATEVEIEADFSAAAYPAAAAALTGGRSGSMRCAESSRQGDRRLFDLPGRDGGAGRRGTTVARRSEGRGGELVGHRRRSRRHPRSGADARRARAVRARHDADPQRRASAHQGERSPARRWPPSFAAPVPRSRNVADGLVIEGVWAEHGAGGRPGAHRPHGDHRIAMAMALVGLRRPNLRIADPACVGKSYPGFWRDLAQPARGDGLSSVAEPPRASGLRAGGGADDRRRRPAPTAPSSRSCCRPPLLVASATPPAGRSPAAGRAPRSTAAAGSRDSWRRPGRDGRPSQEQLRELLLRLFRAKAARRRPRRGAPRRAGAAGRLGGRALADVRRRGDRTRSSSAAEYLWEPEFGFAREALRGVVVREGALHARSAGPAAVRQRLRGPVAAPGSSAVRRGGAAAGRDAVRARTLRAGEDPDRRPAGLRRRSGCAAPAACCSGSFRRRGRLSTRSPAVRSPRPSGSPPATWRCASWRSPENRMPQPIGRPPALAAGAVSRSPGRSPICSAPRRRSIAGDRTGAARHFASAAAEAANPRRRPTLARSLRLAGARRIRRRGGRRALARPVRGAPQLCGDSKPAGPGTTSGSAT